MWSAPNYCCAFRRVAGRWAWHSPPADRSGNIASFLTLDAAGNRMFTDFEAVPDDQRTKPDKAGSKTGNYFL